QGDRRAARQLRAHHHAEPVPAGLDARARRRTQGGPAAAQPSQCALRRRGRLMSGATVAVPLWLLLTGGGLWLLTVALIAIRLRRAPQDGDNPAAPNDENRRLRALE